MVLVDVRQHIVPKVNTITLNDYMLDDEIPERNGELVGTCRYLSSLTCDD